MGYTEVFCMIAYRQKYYKSFAPKINEHITNPRLCKIKSIAKRLIHCPRKGEKRSASPGRAHSTQGCREIRLRGSGACPS